MRFDVRFDVHFRFRLLRLLRFFRLRACKESSAERVYCIKQSELCRKAVLLFAFKLLT